MATLLSSKLIKTARRGPVHRGKLDQPKGGAHAESLRVVRRVNKEITCLLLRGREPEEKGRREKHRILKRFQKDVIKLLDGLDGCIPEDNATFDALQGAAFATSDAATAYAAPLDDGVPLDVPASLLHAASARLCALRAFLAWIWAMRSEFILAACALRSILDTRCSVHRSCYAQRAVDVVRAGCGLRSIVGSELPGCCSSKRGC